MANVQIRNVPPDLHQLLKTRAAGSGRSLNEYLLAELAAIASKPTLAEMSERIRKRKPYLGDMTPVLIRDDRDNRH